MSRRTLFLRRFRTTPAVETALRSRVKPRVTITRMLLPRRKGMHRLALDVAGSGRVGDRGRIEHPHQAREAATRAAVRGRGQGARS
jgi:hypothetical protein